MGHLVQMAGLAVQNFVSAAVGIAVAVALVRGFARAAAARSGNFWVDLIRITAADPAADRRAGRDRVHRRGHGAEPVRRHRRHHPDRRRRSTSPAARSPARRRSRSSARTAAASTTPTAPHPFENPTALDELAPDLPDPADPVQPAAGLRPDGRRHRQGYAIVAVMAILAIASVALTNVLRAGRRTAPSRRRSARRWRARRSASASPSSATFAAVTTLTSTGAVNSFHDSYTAARRR